jgi:hypothetical protein
MNKQVNLFCVSFKYKTFHIIQINHKNVSLLIISAYIKLKKIKGNFQFRYNFYFNPTSQ